MAKRGDVVLYRDPGGRIYNALVDSVSTPNDDLLGSGGESALNLYIVTDYPANAYAPHPAPKGMLKLGYSQEPSIIYDVPHESAGHKTGSWGECLVLSLSPEDCAERGRGRAITHPQTEQAIQEPAKDSYPEFSAQSVADGYWEVYHDDDCDGVITPYPENLCLKCGMHPDFQSRGARKTNKKEPSNANL